MKYLKILLQPKVMTLTLISERLWRSLKYEYVYLRPANDGLELYHGIANWFWEYNHQRHHQALGCQYDGREHAHGPSLFQLNVSARSNSKPVVKKSCKMRYSIFRDNQIS
jgi:Integrase core domain